MNDTTPPGSTLLGLTFIAAPVLLVASALVLLADVGRNPGATSYGSDVEGVVGFLGFVLLVPVFLSLATELRRWKPRLGATAWVVGLVGIAGGGVVNMTVRVMTGALADLGVSTTTMDRLQADFEAGRTLMAPLLVTGPLGPLAAILLGIGFLLAGHHRREAWLLVLGGITLPAGQLFLVATDQLYTLALAAWAAALVPMGLQILRGTAVEEQARA